MSMANIAMVNDPKECVLEEGEDDIDPILEEFINCLEEVGVKIKRSTWLKLKPFLREKSIMEHTIEIEMLNIKTAPKDGTHILGYGVHRPTGRGLSQGICEMHWSTDIKGSGWRNLFSNRVEPTHWAPLPVILPLFDERAKFIEWLPKEPTVSFMSYRPGDIEAAMWNAWQGPCAVRAGRRDMKHTIELEVFNVKDKLPVVPRGHSSIKVLVSNFNRKRFLRRVFGPAGFTSSAEYWAYMPTL